MTKINVKNCSNCKSNESKLGLYKINNKNPKVLCPNCAKSYWKCNNIVHLMMICKSGETFLIRKGKLYKPGCPADRIPAPQ